MPRYEFRCRACGDTFEVNRPMAESSSAATCPSGHDDTVKLLSAVSMTGRGGAAPGAADGAAAGSGGGAGCCGGGCGC